MSTGSLTSGNTVVIVVLALLSIVSIAADIFIIWKSWFPKCCSEYIEWLFLLTQSVFRLFLGLISDESNYSKNWVSYLIIALGLDVEALLLFGWLVSESGFFEDVSWKLSDLVLTCRGILILSCFAIFLLQFIGVWFPSSVVRSVNLLLLVVLCYKVYSKCCKPVPANIEEL